jgi:hypothetical protein
LENNPRQHILNCAKLAQESIAAYVVGLDVGIAHENANVWEDADNWACGKHTKVIECEWAQLWRLPLLAVDGSPVRKKIKTRLSLARRRPT